MRNRLSVIEWAAVGKKLSEEASGRCREVLEGPKREEEAFRTESEVRGGYSVLKMCLESSAGTKRSPEPRVEDGGKTPWKLIQKDYFSTLDLERLCSYKNLGEDHSLTYQYVLSPVYNWLVEFLPKWLAPNLVTLAGLFCVLLSNIVTMMYIPHLTEEAPRWVYLLLFVSLVTYMTLDNLDGRQARRTGSSSPLGHLFDHGCDTLNVFITGSSVAASLHQGAGIWPLSLVWLSGMTVFFGATLEEFYTGALNLGYINGPTEGLLIIQSIFLITGVLGPEVWNNEMNIGPLRMTLGQIFNYASIPLAIPTLIFNYYSIFRNSRATGEKWKFLSSLRTSVSYAIFSVCLFAWHFTSTAFEKHPHLFLWCVGLNFFYLISRLIVAHLTHSRYPTFMGMNIPMVLGAANAVIGMLLGSDSGFFDQYIVLWLLTVVQFVVDARRITNITRQICDHLKIECFRIKTEAKAENGEAKDRRKFT